MTRIVFAPSAKEDLRHARDWYERDGLGLGVAVVEEVRAATNRIENNPEQFAAIYGEIRQCGLKRFPYVVSFRINGDQVEILAILHGHRDPNVWKQRLP